MSRRRASLLGSLTASATVMALIPAGAFGGAHAASGRTVTLKNTRFNPSAIIIGRGEAVTWLWRDGRTKHNVTFASTHSRTQTSGSFTVRFSHSGTFNYRCTIHEAEGMRGRVIVH